MRQAAGAGPILLKVRRNRRGARSQKALPCGARGRLTMNVPFKGLFCNSPIAFRNPNINRTSRGRFVLCFREPRAASAVFTEAPPPYLREYGTARNSRDICPTNMFAPAGVYLSPIGREGPSLSSEIRLAMSLSAMNPRKSPVLDITMSPAAGENVPKTDCNSPTSRRA